MVQYLNGVVETTFGTRPGTGQLGLSALSESLVLDNRYEDVRLPSDGRIPSEIVKGGRLVRGDIMQYVRLDEALFGWLLKSLFGKAPATVEEQVATRWAHTFTLQDDPTVVWPSLSVDVGLMNTTEKRYVGCLADSLDLDVADVGPLGATWGILGRPYTAAAFGSAVARGTQDFLTHSHITTIELDDVALLPGLRLLSLSINNNMEEAFEHSSRNIARGEFGELEIT